MNKVVRCNNCGAPSTIRTSWTATQKDDLIVVQKEFVAFNDELQGVAQEKTIKAKRMKKMLHISGYVMFRNLVLHEAVNDEMAYSLLSVMLMWLVELMRTVVFELLVHFGFYIALAEG
ncbi:hypothetical protein Tco_0699217 [Tanacetum coccineum]